VKIQPQWVVTPGKQTKPGGTQISANEAFSKNNRNFVIANT
jgi:hypothetical protein